MIGCATIYLTIHLLKDIWDDHSLGLLAPRWLSGKESAYQCRRYRFDPRSRKIPHATEQLSPCTTTVEACAPRAHDLQQEKPLQWEICTLQLGSNPRRPQLKKSLRSNKDPAQPKIKKENYFLNNFIKKNYRGFPGDANGKEPACQGRRHKRHGSVPRSGRSLGGGHGNALQYSCLENPMDRGAWWATVHRVVTEAT